MLIPIGLLVAAVIGELCVAHGPLRRIQKPLILLTAALLTSASTLFLLTYPGVGAILIALVSLYSLYNLARLIAGRANEFYLFHSANHTAMWLATAHLVLAYIVLVTQDWVVSLHTYALALAIVQLAVALIIAWSVRRQLRTTRPPRSVPDISDSRLPTITVAVPVRNEGGQLEACLTSILSSNYPKLEVLAFDDHSSDKTPEIIRSFAHSGVRFIRTAKPAQGWLAKNQAYDELAKAANGEYILFMGADVRLAPRSLRQLAGIMVRRHKTMLAVVPQNHIVKRLPLLQAMRYYWEMAPPRRLFRRPPVLSSCWMVERRMLKNAGGFAAMRRSMSPEANLAYYAASHHDGYTFMRSDKQLHITSEKSVSEQQATALLRRYPQVHRRPEMVLALSLVQAVLLLGPFVLVATGLLLEGGWLVSLIAGLAALVNCQAFGTIQQAIFSQVDVWRSRLAMPACIMADIWYLHHSMHRYEFGEVAWKDRSVSGPVMQPPAR